MVEKYTIDLTIKIGSLNSDIPLALNLCDLRSRSQRRK